MAFTSKWSLALALVGLLTLAAAAHQQAADAAAGLTSSRGNEISRPILQLPRTDPEFDAPKLQREQPQQPQPQHQLGATQQSLARFRRQANYARRLRLNNEADVAALLSQRQQQLDQQRGASLFPVQPQASHLQRQQVQLFEDETAIKRQLHELIAQAPNDKSIERALLKMVINASLRNALSNMASPQSAAAVGQRTLNGVVSGVDGNGNWQQADGSFDNGNNNGFDGIPHLSARLEQAIGDYANIDSLSNELGPSSLPLLDPSSYQASVDKREYIKPCSFNAVSCARNVLRRPM